MTVKIKVYRIVALFPKEPHPADWYEVPCVDLPQVELTVREAFEQQIEFFDALEALQDVATPESRRRLKAFADDVVAEIGRDVDTDDLESLCSEYLYGPRDEDGRRTGFDGSEWREDWLIAKLIEHFD